MNAPLVSVIVPIYNVEDYVDQALASIERQTMTDLEIIAIDDGSTDGSGAILDEHEAADPRVRAVHKRNEGYGATCNLGLTLARGTWIALVEPDDWIEPEMLQTLTEFAERTDPAVDIVKASYYSVTSDDPLQKSHCRFKGRIRPASQPFTIDACDRLLRHHPSIWSAIYRRAFLEDNRIRFQEAPGAGWVDNVFLYDTMLRARKILYVDESLYNYREGPLQGPNPFAQAHPDVVLQRWLDMDDVLRDLTTNAPDQAGSWVLSPGVRGAHTKRALNYIDLALPHLGEGEQPREDETTGEAALMELAVAIMDRLDPEIVFSDPEISPRQQDMFALFRNLDEETIRRYKRSPLIRYRSLVADGIANIRANGLGDTFGKLSRLIKK